MSVVVTDRPAAGVFRILINRPEKRNAIDVDVREQMTQALFAAKADTTVRAVVLGGVEGVFSAGGDLDSMGGLDEAAARERMQHIHRLCRLLGHFPVPVVSAVEGYCAGAAVGISLLGDCTVVGQTTRILFPFMGLGLVPDWGSMLTLPRRVGAAKARQLVTAGEVTSGEEAFAIGLADAYVGDGDIMAAAVDHALTMAQLPQSAFTRLKERLNFPSSTLEEELQREEDDQAVLLVGPEFSEGYGAVMAKRKPDFSVVARAISMKAINKIGVVGAGAMGRGIVQLFVQAGHPVVCYDVQPGAVASALENVTRMIARSIDKGRLPASVRDTLEANLMSAESLKDLADCDLVVEAIVEGVSVKQSLFCDLEAVVADDTILASNTSSLIVAEIAARCARPERVAGLHFFNPVPLMKVAEIVSTVRTDAAVVTSLVNVVENAGHRAVVAADQPGFIVNHAGRGLYTEGLRIVEEQVATPQIVDTLMREAAGFKMGPFELLDLTGLDVSGKVMESIYQQFQQEPRFRPSALVPPRMAAGLHGRKTGEGWYRYVDGKRVDAPAAPQPDSPAGTREIWVDRGADQASELEALVTAAGQNLTGDAAAADLLLIQPWGEDASHYCARQSLDSKKTVAIDPLPGLDKHRTLMLTCNTSEEARALARWLLSSDGVANSVINDSPGFVLQRILATIVNIAANIVQRGIAGVDDLEDAVRLGLGYPQGPLHIGDAVGGTQILEILTRQQQLTGDDRYRASLWLRRRVELGVSLLTKEATR